MEKGKVCVTGGGGYQASWLVKLLLSKGYTVHATLRNPDDQKNAHLRSMTNSSERLSLFKADLLDYDTLFAAIKGCDGVFHVATTIGMDNVPDPQKEIFEPAVTGTSNVLKACSVAKVKRLVVVSSMAAVMYNPNWPKDLAMDESCWSDEEFCKTIKFGYSWYAMAKTRAERQALEYGKKTGLDVVTVCPPLIIGPMLQPAMNASSLLLYTILKAGLDTLENKHQVMVDVRDVAEALLLVYEEPAAQGRYICCSYALTMQDLVDKLKAMYPNYNYPKQITEVVGEIWNINSEKLMKLGWKYRSLEETISDSLKDYVEKGYLQ